ncbi:MAG: polysaccharide biosynthesis protein [Ruminococcaceae bacterium]|jgi:stage V sporulation protein B|nr:polysaccharide biosynthesis protein [Oscillospiraceae bacterium]
MSESEGRERGARGVMVLAASNLLVKAAGLFFKIPMNYAVGDAGMGYYNAAYSVYALLYTLSTAGLPVALSVMIAEQRARGNLRGAEQTCRRTLALLFLLGCAGCAFLWVGAGPIAGAIRSPESAHAVRAVAPALLFICVSSAMRGWFQGCGRMTPTAFSQLAEAVGKLIFGIGAALYAVRRGYSTSIAAAYAASGLSVGSFCGMVYLLILRRIGRAGAERDLPGETAPLGRTLSGLTKIALPVTLSASVMSLSSAMDTMSVQRILIASGTSAEDAAALFGNYTSLAVPMFNLPPALIYPFAYALVPAAAAALASGRRDEAAERIERTMRIALFIGIPCACGLAALSDPILCLLFRDSSAHRAAPLLTLLAPASCLVCLTAATNAGLQASGGQRLSLCAMAAGAAVKWIAGELLLPVCGIPGAPLSTAASYLTVTALNLVFLKRRTSAALSFRRTLSPLLSGILCGASARWICAGLTPILGNSAAVPLSIAAAALVYFALLCLTGGFGEAEKALLARLIPADLLYRIRFRGAGRMKQERI